MTLWEDAPYKAGALAGAVGHVLAWDRTSCTCAFAVEEDQEDECANQGETSDDTDDNTGDGASTQVGAGVGRAGGSTNGVGSWDWFRNSDGLHLAAGASGLRHDASGGSRIGSRIRSRLNARISENTSIG